MQRDAIPDWQLTPGGSLKTFYEREITNPLTGQQEFAVGPDAFRAVCEGYACGHCLEYGGFRGSWLPTCPTCGAETGAKAGHLTGEWWLENPTVKP